MLEQALFSPASPDGLHLGGGRCQSVRDMIQGGRG